MEHEWDIFRLDGLAGKEQRQNDPNKSRKGARPRIFYR